jgi:hypothetical protein
MTAVTGAGIESPMEEAPSVINGTQQNPMERSAMVRLFIHGPQAWRANPLRDYCAEANQKACEQSTAVKARRISITKTIVSI